jgi:signal transduction histidine kinase
MAVWHRPARFDIGLTVVLVAICLFGTEGAHYNQHRTAPIPAFVLAVLACLPVLVQRYHPLWTLTVTGGLTLLYLALEYAYGPILLVLLVVIFNAGRRVSIRVMLIAMSALLAGYALVVAIGVLRGTRQWDAFLSFSVWLVFWAGVGMAFRVRRDAATTVRKEQARRAVSEERLRIAQEVHDVAGHGFSVIAMQAGVALRVFDRDPAAAKAALEHIRSASRESLDGLRAEVEALRADVPLRPTTGLADLAALTDRIRASGLPVTLTMPTDRPEVSAEVDRAAYRIVQESLTNVLRHAGPNATASVHIGLEADMLRIVVSDTGPTATVAPGGRGIDGMRDRAEDLGGWFTAAPGPTGGFVVDASLPVGGAA